MTRARLSRVLQWLVVGHSSLSGFSLPPARAEPLRALEYSNSLGDTVWFDRPTISISSLESLTPSGWKSSGPLLRITARAVSPGTPLLILAPWVDAPPSAQEIAEKIMAAEPLPMSSMFPLGDRPLLVREPGHIGNRDDPEQFGWDLHCPVAETSRVRLIFVAVGGPDTSQTSGTPLVPVPRELADVRQLSLPRSERRARYRRIYEFSRVQRMTTVRVLSEIRVDLGARTMASADSAK